MVSLEEHFQAKSKCVIEPISSPRISFSSEFLDENNFISICPKRDGIDRETGARNVDFEFLSGDLTNMIAADELFCEGKLLPFKQTQHAEKLNKIALNTAENAQEGPPMGTDEERRISWFLDDDPSPRPPKCTVLWKELLRLKKQRASTLSPSSSSSSSSSLSSSESSSVDERKKGGGEREKAVSRAKKGLERTRSSSSSMRIRPMINVPICQPTKNASLPPLFPLRRGRLES